VINHLTEVLAYAHLNAKMYWKSPPNDDQPGVNHLPPLQQVYCLLLFMCLCLC
jgi:hypothetical protein